jgi:ORF6N domain
LLDSDLAELYSASVKRLNEQVKRNPERFPADFVFQLSAKEHDLLRSQVATSKSGRGGRRYPPYAFTEHGAIMAATVLNSQCAVEMSVFVVRAFVRMRETLTNNRPSGRQTGRIRAPPARSRCGNSGVNQRHSGTDVARASQARANRVQAASQVKTATPSES